MTARTGYSTAQILLHWITALLIFAAWMNSDGMGRALDARLAAGETGITGNTPHVWLGGLVLAVVLGRLVLRLVTGAPGPEAGTGALAAAAALWGHRLLYALMLAVPLAGAVTWYLGIEDAGEVHETLGNGLMIIAGAHAAIAILHTFRGKLGLLRMVRPQA